MLILYAYAACSITIALCIVFEAYLPTLKKAIADGVDTSLTRSPKLGMFVTFLINLVLAPFMLIVIMMPNAFASLDKGFDKIIREEG